VQFEKMLRNFCSDNVSADVNHSRQELLKLIQWHTRLKSLVEGNNQPKNKIV